MTNLQAANYEPVVRKVRLLFLALIDGTNHSFDVTAHIEIAFERKLKRIASRDKIIPDFIDDMFVKDFYVAE